jgi:iron complex transport system permease protein
MTALAATRHVVVRQRGLSLRLETRAVAVNLLLLVLLTGLSLWSISAGDFPIAPGDVVATLLGQGTGPNEFIVFGLRLPRLLTGIAVGMALGLSGAIFQSLARNPLASPDIIGFNPGAALGAVTMVVVFGASGVLVALGALGGGLTTAAFVYLLALRDGVSPLRLVLVGIGLGYFAWAGVDFLMTRSDIFEAAAAQVWLTGSLNARVWTDVWVVGLGVLILAPVALMLQPALDRLELGEDTAAALGVGVGRTRLAAALIGTLLAACAVAAAGPLTFVALASAPIARRMADTAGVALVTSALVGAAIVIVGDLAGRLAFAPMQLPVGVFTAILGAPYLLWLLATQIRKGAM